MRNGISLEILKWLSMYHCFLGRRAGGKPFGRHSAVRRRAICTFDFHGSLGPNLADGAPITYSMIGLKSFPWEKRKCGVLFFLVEVNVWHWVLWYVECDPQERINIQTGEKTDFVR